MSRVVSVVTVYYPVYEHIKNIHKMALQSDEVIICDNSPQNNEKMFINMNHVTYCFWGENLGISAAFNKVLKDDKWKWNDEDFVIFFDQDSAIADGHIFKLIDEYNILTASGYNVGCLGPVFFNDSKQQIEFPKLYRKITENSIKVSSIMTSSMVFRYKNLKDIDFWNDEIFLDLADWDICWRIQNLGMLCVMTNVSVLNHKLGEGQKNIGPISLRVGKPVREYYQTRDCQYLLHKDYVPFKFKVRFIAMLTIRPVLHLLFLDDKEQRKYYIKKGIMDYRDGVKGVIRNRFV